MLRQSSSRTHRNKKLRPSHSLQAVLLVAVGVWIAYQLTRSYGRQRVVAVETDGEPERRLLGRKGFVDGIVGVGGGGSDVGRGTAGTSDDRSSQAGEAGDEEDQEADGDDGVDSDVDAAGLAADEEEDDPDFLSESGRGDDELETAQGQAQNGLNMTVVPQVNATDSVQDGAAVLPVNATGGVADGAALTSGGSALKNNISSDDQSLHDSGSSPGENQSLQINKNGTAHSVAEHVIT
ncbi:unnamed protein product [Urochloa humidicola]